jgi:hypothetical protein
MAKSSLVADALPGPVGNALAALGENIRLARIRRRLRMADLAGKVMVSVPTLRRVERGDPGVAIGVYLTALWSLGLGSELRRIAAPESDQSALTMDLSQLPRRVRVGASAVSVAKPAGARRGG